MDTDVLADLENNTYSEGTTWEGTAEEDEGHRAERLFPVHPCYLLIIPKGDSNNLEWDSPRKCVLLRLLSRSV